MKTLDLINQAREAFALEPLDELPKGRRTSERYCPVALALSEIFLSVRVFRAHIDFNSNDTAKKIGRIWGEPATGLGCVLMPIAIRQFVTRFDKGHFPKYEQDA